MLGLLAAGLLGACAEGQHDPPVSIVAGHAGASVGAVFDGEIGKDVIGERERHLLQRLGSPAARERDCLRYAMVGRPRGAWNLCLERGRVARAWADWP
jgi:hypothetical protein